ncbi:hypothetical protein [Mesorhizobium sp. INR15]|uniref:hypothetical protein n=1 Tax=Mesorhizobium sp. INR15 TaxID=2654248 RepID=UPI0018966025|nr:hypothetical protein [Mesorhizobium sp. INR15]QPC94070.1 hypothetical protein GA829_27700 [Mesorhizobium sp. INR15]
MKFEDEADGDTKHPSFIDSGKSKWRYSAIPLGILALWLVSPEDKGAAIQKQLDAAQSELAAVKSDLVLMQSVAHVASVQARSSSDTAVEQKQLLETERRRADTLVHDLAVAKHTIGDLKAKAELADHARQVDETSFAKVSKALDEAGQQADISEQRLATLLQASNVSKASADTNAVERTAAVRAQAVAEAALKAANDTLEQERALAASRGRDLEKANVERDAAYQRSAELTAALEQDRQRLAGMAGDLSAAHKTIEDMKTQSDRLAKGPERSPKVRATANAPTSLPGRPPRQSGLGGKQKSETRKSRRVIEATITLPDALLPIPPINQ